MQMKVNKTKEDFILILIRINKMIHSPIISVWVINFLIWEILMPHVSNLTQHLEKTYYFQTYYSKKK